MVHHLKKEGLPKGFYTITSPTAYLTGAVRGDFPPLGNHIQGEMGGYWYPPVKILKGFEGSVEYTRVEDGVLLGFRYGYSWVTHHFSLPRLMVKRHVSLSGNTLEIQYVSSNAGVPLAIRLSLSRVPSWNTRLNFELTHTIHGDTVFLKWRAASLEIAASVSPTRGRLKSVDQSELVYTGIGGASIVLEVNRSKPQAGLVEDSYSLCVSSPKIYGEVYNRALRNLRGLVRADGLGVYFSAGHPEFPWLFGIDTCYIVEHTRFAGFSRLRGEALKSLLFHRDPKLGLIPHEVTHGGEIYNPGDLEETAFFVKLYIERALDSGSLQILGEAYKTCKTLLQSLEAFDEDGDLVAEGPGIVEREGREKGAKIDVACYTALAYRAMAQAAKILGRREKGEWEEAWRTITHEINAKYWCPKTQTYRQLKIGGEYVYTGDWTYVIPFATGIAPPERGVGLKRLAEEPYSGRFGLYLYENTEGIKPQKDGAEPPSMPIGTGLLASSLFRYGYHDEGWSVINKLVSIYGLSGPGYLAEIAPDLGCHTQAWSYSAYVSSLIEAALSPSYDGPTKTLSIDPPKRPKAYLEFRGLRFGDSLLDFKLDQNRLLITVGKGGVCLKRRGWKDIFELAETQSLELTLS
ncbi:MAG: hypothetical protein QW429_04595 [Thermoprotei archaeon]